MTNGTEITALGKDIMRIIATSTSPDMFKIYRLSIPEASWLISNLINSTKPEDLTTIETRLDTIFTDNNRNVGLLSLRVTEISTVPETIKRSQICFMGYHQEKKLDKPLGCFTHMVAKDNCYFSLIHKRNDKVLTRMDCDFTNIFNCAITCTIDPDIPIDERKITLKSFSDIIYPFLSHRDVAMGTKTTG